MKNFRNESLIFNTQLFRLLLDIFQIITIDPDIQNRVLFSLLNSRDDFFILAAADGNEFFQTLLDGHFFPGQFYLSHPTSLFYKFSKMTTASAILFAEVSKKEEDWKYFKRVFFTSVLRTR